jgi:hypothetical protein
MIDAAERAVRSWARIQRKPATIVFDRDGTPQTAQVVRVTFDNARLTRGGEVGINTERRVVIFGVKDHPTITATTVRVGDRFAILKTIYEVDDVIELPGSVQAFAKRVTS